MSSSEEEPRGSFKSRKRPRTASNGKKCNLCQLSEIPDFEATQPLLEFDNLRAHYFCLLFSSGLGQSGQESEGLHGFLAADVRRELKRGARLKCVYCKLKGATVGCAKAECKKSYHLPCGMKHGSLQEFFDQFKSFCSLHRPAQKPNSGLRKKAKSSNVKCTICQEDVCKKASFDSLWAPCCSAFFHRVCVQRMALGSQNWHFRCPNCTNNEKFAGEMQRLGIYLHKNQDESFDVTTEKECGAKVCFCDKEQGRKYNFPDGLWELLVCYSCGSCAIHAKCGGMEDLIEPQWHCYVCRRAVRTKEPMDKRKLRPINEVWGTALGRKTDILQTTHSSKSIDYTSSVTITPIPKSQVKDQNFPMKSSLPSGVEIRRVLPVAPMKNLESRMNLSLDDIIKAGLEKKAEETNYKCTKAFAEQYDQPVPKEVVQDQKNSVDLEQGSPGDSDYESAQEANNGQLPFKIRKNSANFAKKNVEVVRTAPKVVLMNSSANLQMPLAVSAIDSRIQKSIKDFFKAS